MMGPTIAKKESFDGLHNHLKNHFETKFPFLVILMGPTITKKEILMANITPSIIILE